MDAEPTSNQSAFEDFGHASANPEGLPPDHQDAEPEPEPEGLPADNGDPRDLPEREGINTKLTRRVIGHLTAEGTEDEVAIARDKAYRQGTALMFRYIADLLGLGPTEANRKEKSILFNAIITKVSIRPSSLWNYIKMEE